MSTNTTVEAVAQRVVNLMIAGDPYNLALSSVMISTHLTPPEWVAVIARVEELRHAFLIDKLKDALRQRDPHSCLGKLG